MLRQKLNRAIAVLLCVMLCAASAAPSAMALDEMIEPSSKEEVIYVNMDGAGEVKSIDVVNILTPENGQIIDYGDYSQVRNMTTTDELSYSDGVISARTDAQKIYFDGAANNLNAPWKVSVLYVLDGQAISAEELAGRSGHLRIELHVVRNDDYAGPDFYKNYALQSSIQLESDKCNNLVANDATIANVGQKKQLSYVALPNKGADYVIEADVEGFETNGFSINGIPLSLNVEIDDSELMSKVYELQNAIARIDDGSTALSNGLNTFKTGLNRAQSVVSQTGVTQANLTTALNRASLALEKATAITDKSAELIAASNNIKLVIANVVDMTAQLQDTVTPSNFDNMLRNKGADAATMKGCNNAVIETLNNQIAELEQLIAGLDEDDSEMAADLNSQIAALNIAINQIQTNSNSIDQLDLTAKNYVQDAHDGLARVHDGAVVLRNKYDEFDEGLHLFLEAVSQLQNIKANLDQVLISYGYLGEQRDDYSDAVAALVAGYRTMVDGTTQLVNGGNALSGGTHQLRKATANLDSQVEDKIDGILRSIQGEAQIGSYVSENNTRVNAVQFVYKTAKIAKENELKVEGEEVQKLSFWDKIVRLFKK